LRTHKHTNPQNSTLTDNKGPLKLSAREPIGRKTEGQIDIRQTDSRADDTIMPLAC